MRCLSVKHRNLILKRKTQDDLNVKKKGREAPRVLSPEQWKELRERFKNRKAINSVMITKAYNEVMDAATKLSGEIGKRPQACLRLLMQLARVARTERKTSLWNAYVAICYEEGKPGQSARLVGTSDYFNDLCGFANILEGVTDKDFVRMIAIRWAGLSMREKESLAGARTSQIQDDRKTKLTGAHTCMVKAFHDVSATLCRVENIVSFK